MRFSIIVPALDEAHALGEGRSRFERLRRAGCEMILVDGGSADETIEVARPLFHEVVRARAGRACQMNAGARAAGCTWLVFAHVDTVLDREHLAVLDAAVSAEPTRRWGRFDIRLSGRDPRFALIERAMNVRSRWTGIATGDQAMFVRADEFHAVGGYPDQPLMEDIEISKRLKRRSRPLCLRCRVTTSSRRWKRNGVLRTVWLMWRLRLAYTLGGDPAALARRYYPDRCYEGPPSAPREHRPART